MSLDILLVEDHPADLLMTQKALRKAGLVNEVHVARDGEDAIRQLLEAGGPQFGLVLLDLNLPGATDGHTVLRMMRANPRTQSTPVIVLTTSQEDIDVLRSYELDAQGFVRKPLDMRDFFTIVQSISSLGIEITAR